MLNRRGRMPRTPGGQLSRWARGTICSACFNLGVVGAAFVGVIGSGVFTGQMGIWGAIYQPYGQLLASWPLAAAAVCECSATVFSWYAACGTGSPRESVTISIALGGLNGLVALAALGLAAPYAGRSLIGPRPEGEPQDVVLVAVGAALGMAMAVATWRLCRRWRAAAVRSGQPGIFA